MSPQDGTTFANRDRVFVEALPHLAYECLEGAHATTVMPKGRRVERAFHASRQEWRRDVYRESLERILLILLQSATRDESDRQAIDRTVRRMIPLCREMEAMGSDSMVWGVRLSRRLHGLYQIRNGTQQSHDPYR